TSLLGALWPRPQLHGPLMFAMVAVFGLLLLIPLLGGSARSRRYVLASLALMLACYGTIAAGRSAFYNANPQLGSSDRYYYIAAMVTVLALCVCVTEAGHRIRDRVARNSARRPIAERMHGMQPTLTSLATVVLVVWAGALLTAWLMFGRAI